MNAIERLRKWGPGDYTRYWNRESAEEFDADLAAVEALYQAAKKLGDSHGNPYDETYAESTPQTFTLGGSYVSRKRLDALSAAVRRVEGE